MADRLGGKRTLEVTSFLEEFEKDDVRKGTDIVRLFGDLGVNLTKKGKSYTGLCPFHDDHNPSLSVDREKGLFNCFGCGASGDVFDAVQLSKGFGFREALAWLKDWQPSTSMPVAVTPQRDKVKKPSDGNGKYHGQISLDVVADFYHKALIVSKKARVYLAGRGINDPAISEQFKLGFCDGSLLSKLSDNQKEELKESGIITKTGREHFHYCVVVPLYDEQDQVAGFYGRKIDDSKPAHLYLPGDHKGLMNRQALKAYRDEIIITEAVIDALSLIQIGIKNVIPCYGVNGFTDMHLKAFKDNRVKTVVIAFDNDEAGRKGAEKVQETLLQASIQVKTIFPEQKDWNYAILQGLTADKVRQMIDEAPLLSPQKDKSGFQAVKEGSRYIFTCNGITYRVLGVKELFVANLRVNIRAEHEDNVHLDNVDLYSARSRNMFALSFSHLLGVEPSRVEKDLMALVDYLEAERDCKLNEQMGSEKVPELTEEERRIGLEFLTSPDLFDQIVNDMETLGYVGEDLNKQLMYLCASSRILDDPISILILSQAAAGKSMLAETVRRLMPDEGVIAVTSLSEQALNYVESLEHKFMVLGEAVHGEIIEHQIREMLSNRELSRLVTVKDEKTGELRSRLMKTPAVVASVMTSTRNDINPENTSRCFIINADESKLQTRRIHGKQKEKYTLQRYREKDKAIPAIIRKHRSAQRLLRKPAIDNQLNRFLSFPDTQLRLRRDHERFIDLIAVVCFLRQYRKEVKHDGEYEYIECGTSDYRIAYRIMTESVLSSTMIELPKAAFEIYEAVREIVREKAQRLDLKGNEVTFTQKEVREHTGYGQTWVKQHIRLLVEYEYLQRSRGGGARSKGFYQLLADVDIQLPSLGMIPTPEELENELRKAGMEYLVGY